MPHFRPLPVLTLVSLPVLALLLTLGGWQVQRMGWKTDRIAAFEARGEVAGFAAAICGADRDNPFGPRVTGPAPITGETLRYYALRSEGPGWIHVGAITLPGCREGEPDQVLLVETGFESLTGNDRITADVWRIEPLPAANAFTSRNDPDTNQWYRFDHDAMAARLGLDPDQVLYVWAPADRGLPESLAEMPPARHLGYALTWFGLALTLVGVYVALHGARGRLRLR